jgi:YbbR domain-containing protein
MTLRRFGSWLVKNIGWRISSLVIAYVIWMSVATEPELATIVSAPVQYRDAGNNLEVSSPLVDRVELETRGPSGLLRNLSNLRTVVILDFADVKDPGQRTFTITRDSTNLPQGVELLRATPAQIRLTFEERMRKTVPVHVRFAGNLPNGLKMTGLEVIPADKVIFGPASQVDRVSAVETDSIDLRPLARGNFSARVAVFAPESKVRFLKDPQVTVKITIR